MDFLLESLGFPPGTDYVRLASRVEERQRSGGRFEFGCGLGLHLERRERSQLRWSDEGLWPSFRGGAPVRLVVERILGSGADAGLPSVEARLGRAPGSGGPKVRAGWVGAEAPREGSALFAHLCGFAVDVHTLDRSLRKPERSCPRFAGDPRRRRAGAWLQSGDPRAPRDVALLDLEIDAVYVLENPLTRESFDLIEAAVPGGRLALFASRWQLREDGLPAPEPGMRLAGAFWIGCLAQDGDRLASA